VLDLVAGARAEPDALSLYEQMTAGTPQKPKVRAVPALRSVSPFGCMPCSFVARQFRRRPSHHHHFSGVVQRWCEHGRRMLHPADPRNAVPLHTP